MIKQLKLITLLVAITVAQTIKTQEHYDQAKKFVQKTVREAQRNYTVDYQAAKDGGTYGLFAGAVKSFIPCAPKRGKGFISCALIGAVMGASANLVLNRNAEYIMGVKNKLEYAFSLQEKKE